MLEVFQQGTLMPATAAPLPFSVADDAMLDFLRKHGAGKVAHSGRNLFYHLVRTRNILAMWECGESIQRAGLFHSVFGTTVFETSLLDPSLRPEVERLIGEDALRRVDLFANGWRGKRILAALMAPDTTGGAPAGDVLVDLALLEAANGIEQGRVSPFLSALLDLQAGNTVTLPPRCSRDLAGRLARQS